MYTLHGIESNVMGLYFRGLHLSSLLYIRFIIPFVHSFGIFPASKQYLIILNSKSIHVSFQSTSAGISSTPDAFLTFVLYTVVLTSSLLMGAFNREQSDSGKGWLPGSRMISRT